MAARVPARRHPGTASRSTSAIPDGPSVTFEVGPPSGIRGGTPPQTTSGEAHVAGQGAPWVDPNRPQSAPAEATPRQPNPLRPGNQPRYPSGPASPIRAVPTAQPPPEHFPAPAGSGRPRCRWPRCRSRPSNRSTSIGPRGPRPRTSEGNLANEACLKIPAGPAGPAEGPRRGVRQDRNAAHRQRHRHPPTCWRRGTTRH